MPHDWAAESETQSRMAEEAELGAARSGLEPQRDPMLQLSRLQLDQGSGQGWPMGMQARLHLSHLAAPPAQAAFVTEGMPGCTAGSMIYPMPWCGVKQYTSHMLRSALPP